MAKSILKEVIIILLLLVAIALVMGIFFYKYIPDNKVVPIAENYSTPESVKEELETVLTNSELNSSDIIITREFTNADLEVYKVEKSYVDGKVNPFGYLTETEEVGGENVVNPATPYGNSKTSSGNTSGNGGTSQNGGIQNSQNNAQTTGKETKTAEPTSTAKSSDSGTFFKDTGTK